MANETYNQDSCFVMDRQRMHLGGNMKGGDPKTFSPEVWEYLIRRFGVRNVLDVGCGTGEALRWFGWRVPVIGIEGLPQNAEQCELPVIMHDLATGPVNLHGIDLVWCCEVVEHVAEEHLDNLLSVMCCGRVLAMTHAVPGQGGFHHVNEQPEAYWVEKIQSRGMKLSWETPYIRTLAGDKQYFRKTGLVFER